jgi:hypothetical protein
LHFGQEKAVDEDRKRDGEQTDEKGVGVDLVFVDGL